MSKIETVNVDEQLQKMKDSEYLSNKDASFVMAITEGMAVAYEEYFGRNDGEPLDGDGINFINQFMKLEMLHRHGIEKTELIVL